MAYPFALAARRLGSGKAKFGLGDWRCFQSKRRDWETTERRHQALVYRRLVVVNSKRGGQRSVQLTVMLCGSCILGTEGREVVRWEESMDSIQYLFLNQDLEKRRSFWVDAPLSIHLSAILGSMLPTSCSENYNFDSWLSESCRYMRYYVR